MISPKFHPIVGGGETFILNSVEQLHQAGVDVSIAVEPNQNRQLENYPYPVCEINGLCDDKLDVIKSADGLSQLIDTLKPDLLHVHGYFALLATGLANNRKVPVIVSIHSTPVWGERIVGGMSGFEQELFFARQITAWTKPEIITAANEVYAQAAKKIVGGETLVRTFPYPILQQFYEVTERSKYRKAFGLREEDILLTVPSRVIERKGIKEAVVALSKLPTNYFLCLPCASQPQDKEYWADVQTSLEYQSVSKRIIVPKDMVLPADMPLLYAATDIVIMPSYYEGAPVATIEAMASKRPFIGADAQGINNFITHGENGLLVPKKSTSALAQAIVQLANDTHLQVLFTAQASADVQRLSWVKQLPRLLEMYHFAIHRHNQPEIKRIFSDINEQRF